MDGATVAIDRFTALVCNLSSESGWRVTECFATESGEVRVNIEHPLTGEMVNGVPIERLLTERCSGSIL